MNDAAANAVRPSVLPSSAEDWLARVAALAPAMAAAGPEADRARRLPEPLVDALHDQGFFRLLLPRAFGGAEVSLPTRLAVSEALALHDASTSWCVVQANGCAMMAAYLDAKVAEAIWGRDPRAILAWGPGKAEARAVDGGYEVTLRISFVSGGRHANWFGAHCPVVERDGSVRRDADGEPESRTVMFPARLAPMIDNWNVIGLRGTGSDSFAADRVFVPEDHTVVREVARLDPALAPLYRFSQYATYGIGFAGTALGIARAFIDAFVPMTRAKQPRLVATTLDKSAVVHDEVARAEARLSAARAFLVGETERVWDAVAASPGPPAVPQRVRLRLAATHAIQEAKAAVDALYDLAGTDAIFAAGPFERRFRDMHTVAQQIQGRKTHYQVVGAWMLGHPPDLNVI